MAKKRDYKKISDTQIVTLVDDNVRRSVGYYDSEISKERTKVVDYYNAVLPRPAHDGNSKYVSQDVFDSIESMKAQLLEVFSSGSGIVKFDAQNEEDVAQANVCTAYADYVAFRQNDLYSVMATAIHDSLVARNGIAKVFWQEQTDFTTEYFENLTPDELDMLLAQDNVELKETTADEFGLVSGEICLYRDTSQVIIENVAPEEFLIEPQARSLEDVNFCAHRTRKTLSDLRNEGYSESLLSEIGDHGDVDLETDPEVLARHGNSSRGFGADAYQDQVRSVQITEAFINIDIEGSGVADLYKVTKAGNVLLDKTKVSRRPFIAFAALQTPHAFFGANFGSKVIATQNARTVLTRSILDHAMITNNPRYTVVKGGLTNPKELTDNRVGGLVNVSRPDAIMPMVQAPLNPFVFKTIEMLDEDKQDTTGINRLSTGTNKDAVSKQNSAAMVEQLSSMSQGRQKIIARNFANQFLKPLYQEIYQLVIENETEEKMVELAGNFVPVDPSKWADRRDVSISLHLGYGEQENESRKYMAMHQVFVGDPELSKMYTSENQYALMKKVMELSGVKNVTEYLTSPSKLPPEQPNPAEELQLEMLKKQIEVTERQTQVAELKTKMQAQNDAMKIQLETLKAENAFAISSDEVDLAEAQLLHKKFIDAAELAIVQQADEIAAIASPRG